MREREIEAYLVKRVNAMGGETRKVQWIGRDGAPDRLVMLPGDEGRSVWVELKADDLPGEFPRDAHERTQHREHERMRSFGLRVVVVNSLQGVEELLS